MAKPAKSTIATELGVSRGRVSQLVAAGMPSDTVAAAKLWYTENINARNPPPDEGVATGPADDSASLGYWRVRRERLAVERGELEARRLAGDLVDRAGVERAAYDQARQIQRALVETLPSKISPELAALCDQWSVECLLREKIREELRALSSDALETNAADAARKI